MPTARDLIDWFVEQETADVDDVLDALVEFTIENHLVEDAATAPALWIDDQELTEVLATFFQRKGVGLEDE